MSKVLNTNIVLYLLGGRLAAPLPKAEYTISIITEMELLSYPGIRTQDELIIRELISEMKVVGLNEEIKECAVRLRRQHKLKLPDAIIASTAYITEAELVTNDEKLCSVPGINSVRLQIN